MAGTKPGHDEARGLQGLEHRAFLVIDGGVEAEFAGQPVALVLAAGDADNAASFYSGDLADGSIRPEPAAAEIPTVSPAFGFPISSSP